MRVVRAWASEGETEEFQDLYSHGRAEEDSHSLPVGARSPAGYTVGSDSLAGYALLMS